MATITKKETKSKAEEVLSKPYRLDLHNDDYNTFDWVIQCLIKVCNHEYEQANQCAHLVHYNGKRYEIVTRITCGRSRYARTLLE